MDIITQVANGCSPRCVTPMAPVSETSQKEPVQDRATAKVTTVAHGTPVPAGRRSAREDLRAERVAMTCSSL